ncbi:MAG TPA: outer membrane protein assembly factor BamE [Allosphingosinicella sp.]|jgi:outer membrane protein assembly factor BamE (lipoprotein component of BamABCDE complex)
MSLRFSPRVLLAAALGASFLSAGCSSIRDHQGYVGDQQLIAAIQPGVDNRDSVERTLGRPSFVGQFDQRDWYYVDRQTRQLAFQHPSPSEQTVLRVRFDEQGNVERVERSGMELVANIDPSNEETPTLGRNRSFFEEIFGNIGSTAPGQRGQTQDNPQ